MTNHETTETRARTDETKARTNRAASDRCSVCGAPFEDTGKKQQCRRCGMFANLCCDPQMPVELEQWGKA